MTVLIDLEPIENAVATWMRAGAGFVTGDGKLIWGDQGGPPPETPYVTLRWTSGPDKFGEDWRKLEKDPDTGVVTARHRGRRTMTLEIQFFTAETTTEVASRAVLDGMIAAHRTQAIAKVLRLAGVGIGPIGRIRSLPSEETFPGRAVCELTLHVGGEFTETIDTIEHVQATVTGIDDTGAEATASGWTPDPPPDPP